MKKLVLSLVCACLVIAGCLTTNGNGANVCQPLSTDQIVCVTNNKVNVIYNGVDSTSDAFMLEQFVIAHNIKHIEITLVNGGGNVFLMCDYLDMMQRLQNKGVMITTHARGLIASAAVPIFLMGDRRTIAPSAWIMMHPGTWHNTDYYGQPIEIPESMRVMLEMIEGRYAMIVSQRTKMTYEAVLKILRGCNTRVDQYWMNADEAVYMGFATEVEL